jgi:Ras-related protein Rap-1A/Ras-related protein Rap-1B
MDIIKVAVMGGGGVGKSTLTVQYVQQTFINKYDPTIEDSYRKQTTINGKMTMLEILDTAGTEQFVSMRDIYINNSDCIIVAYSIISKSSLDDAINIHDHITLINENQNTEPIIILCGTKCDIEEERVIDKEQGQSLADEWGCLFIETSAKLNKNINECFELVCSQVIQKNNMIKNKKKKHKCILI